MSTVPLSEAKARLSQIADEVHRTHEQVTITKNGRSYLVLMSAEDLESLEATLELLGDADAIRRVPAGRSPTPFRRRPPSPLRFDGGIPPSTAGLRRQNRVSRSLWTE